jgi:hypothetical protein
MLEMGYCKLFHGLTLNHDPPSLSLQSSQNFRHEPGSCWGFNAGFWWAELFLLSSERHLLRVSSRSFVV